MSQTLGGDTNTETSNGQQPSPKAPGKKAARKAGAKQAAPPIAADPPATTRKQRSKAQIAKSVAKMRATIAAKAAGLPLVGTPTAVRLKTTRIAVADTSTPPALMINLVAILPPAGASFPLPQQEAWLTAAKGNLGALYPIAT